VHLHVISVSRGDWSGQMLSGHANHWKLCGVGVGGEVRATAVGSRSRGRWNCTSIYYWTLTQIRCAPLFGGQSKQKCQHRMVFARPQHS